MEFLTTADVAELVGHPDPGSRAGMMKVGRLVKRGMPFIPHTRPRLFCRADVEAWLADQSGPAPISPATVTPPRPTDRRTKRRTSAQPGALAGLVEEMKARLA